MFFCVLLGYELLFQPEVVRVYTSLLRESKNPSVLEAAAGAIQNLCAGRWTVRAIFRFSVLSRCHCKGSGVTDFFVCLFFSFFSMVDIYEPQCVWRKVFP